MRLLGIGGLIVLLSQTVSAAEISVTKDASLIHSSLCCGSGAADQNFGSKPTVDAGRYHHDSRALLGFSLEGVNALQSVQLVLPGSTVGSSPADFSVSVVWDDWDEQTVTFHNAPASQPLDASSLWLEGRLRFDVTTAVREALEAGKCSISFVVTAEGGTNLFIPSRENTSGLQPAFLELNAQ